MKKKTISLTVIIAIVISMIMTACSTAKPASSSSASAISASTGPVTITFWDENAGPTRTPYYSELIKQFEAANPNITVNYLGLPQTSSEQKMNVAVASNTAPDVSGMQIGWLSSFIAKNCLLPLDSYFNNWSEKNDISSSYIQALRAVPADKKLYMMPWSANMPTFWYRTDLFQGAGLSAPSTWNDFFNDISKLTDKSKNQYGYTIRGGSGGGYQLLDFLVSYSGITSYFDAKGKSTLTDSKVLEGLKKLVATYNVDTPASDITNGYTQMVAQFDSGSVAIMQHNMGSYSTHQQSLAGKFAAMKIPKAVNGKQVVTDIGLIGPVIYKSTKNPDAAWKFVSFLGSHSSQSYWNQNIGQLPTNSLVSSDSWIKDMQHLTLGMSYLGEKNAIVVMEPYYLPDFDSIMTNTVQPNFQSVLAGKMTPSDFLTTWANAMTKAQADYVKNNKATSETSSGSISNSSTSK
jgi:multiple sugar transport system substrate-binding protein